MHVLCVIFLPFCLSALQFASGSDSTCVWKNQLLTIKSEMTLTSGTWLSHWKVSYVMLFKIVTIDFAFFSESKWFELIETMVILEGTIGYDGNNLIKHWEYSNNALALIVPGSDELCKENRGGLSFELILQPAIVDNPPDIVMRFTSLKGSISQEDIARKLKDAEHRRLVSLNQLNI